MTRSSYQIYKIQSTSFRLLEKTWKERQEREDEVANFHAPRGSELRIALKENADADIEIKRRYTL